MRFSLDKLKTARKINSARSSQNTRSVLHPQPAKSYIRITQIILIWLQVDEVTVTTLGSSSKMFNIVTSEFFVQYDIWQMKSIKITQ